MSPERSGGRGHRSGLTLVELLVTIAIVAVLVGLMLVAVGRVRTSAAVVQTAEDLRSLGRYVASRATDHRGELPRSRHSGFDFAHPERMYEQWTYEYFDFTGADGVYENVEDRKRFVNERLRSPLDDRTDLCEGYGFNVYFELRGDDDPSGPVETADGRSWRRLSLAPAPVRTVLFGETGSPPATMGTTPQPRDHFMAHFWAQYGADTTHEVRSGPTSAPPVFCFLDGHTESRPFEDTFQRIDGDRVVRDLWNPATAGRR